jgi:PST family polysaccharide transporter
MFNAIKDKLLLSPAYVKMAKNMGWIIGDKLMRIFAGLYVTAWIARYLGPDDFGVYNYALAFVAFFTIFSTLGIDQILLREIVHHEDKRDEILGTTFLMRMTGSLLCVTFATLVMYIIKHGQNITVEMVFLFAVSTIFQSFDVIEVFFKSQVLIRFSIVAKSIPFIIMNVVKIWLVLHHASLVWFGAAYTVELFLCSIGMVVAYKRYRFVIFNWKFSMERARHLFKQNLPLLFSSLAIMFYMKIDQILLGELIGTRAVGIYTAATKITEISYLLPVAIITTVAPSITKLFQVDKVRYQERKQKFFNLMTLISLMVIVPIMLLSPFIIRLLYGQKYQQSELILAIHVWTFFFVSWGVVKELTLVTEGIQHISLWTTLIAMAVNVILNFTLIPIYHEVGAAIAAIAGQLVSTTLAPGLFRASRSILRQEITSLYKFYDIR